MVLALAWSMDVGSDVAAVEFAAGDVADDGWNDDGDFSG